MGLFGNSSKKSDNPLGELMNKIFPNGKSDIESGTLELLNILEFTISKEIAQNIFVKSTAISLLSEQFDVERLAQHLNGYCKGIFSPKELQNFYDYLIARKIAMAFGGKVRKDSNGNYCW